MTAYTFNTSDPIVAGLSVGSDGLIRAHTAAVVDGPSVPIDPVGPVEPPVDPVDPPDIDDLPSWYTAPSMPSWYTSPTIPSGLPTNMLDGDVNTLVMTSGILLLGGHRVERLVLPANLDGFVIEGPGEIGHLDCQGAWNGIIREVTFTGLRGQGAEREYGVRGTLQFAQFLGCDTPVGGTPAYAMYLYGASRHILLRGCNLECEGKEACFRTEPVSNLVVQYCSFTSHGFKHAFRLHGASMLALVRDNMMHKRGVMIGTRPEDFVQEVTFENNQIFMEEGNGPDSYSSFEKSTAKTPGLVIRGNFLKGGNDAWSFYGVSDTNTYEGW